MKDWVWVVIVQVIGHNDIVQVIGHNDTINNHNDVSVCLAVDVRSEHYLFMMTLGADLGLSAGFLSQS